MKNILPLIIISIFLFSCEKEDPKVSGNSNTSNEKILGNWGPWKNEIKRYDSLGNYTNQHAEASFGGSLVEFKADNSITHTVIGQYNASGTYSISGNKINLTLSNGVFNNGGGKINILSPNPYTGYIDVLDNQRLVFRDSIFHSDGYYDISIYSAERK